MAARGVGSSGGVPAAALRVSCRAFLYKFQFSMSRADQKASTLSLTSWYPSGVRVSCLQQFSPSPRS